MIYFLLSLFLGFIAVIQGGLNKQITQDWGLAGAVTINSSILLLIVIVFAVITASFPQYFPHIFIPKFNWATWKWWYIIPAFCGFALIAGIPYAISKQGALIVFLAIVVGQMLCSLFWDYYMEAIPISPKRIIGAFLAIAGLAITVWR